MSPAVAAAVVAAAAAAAKPGGGPRGLMDLAVSCVGVGVGPPAAVVIAAGPPNTAQGPTLTPLLLLFVCLGGEEQVQDITSCCCSSPAIAAVSQQQQNWVPAAGLPSRWSLNLLKQQQCKVQRGGSEQEAVFKPLAGVLCTGELFMQQMGFIG